MQGLKSATLAKLKNSQNGTFEPVHEIWNPPKAWNAKLEAASFFDI